MIEAWDFCNCETTIYVNTSKHKDTYVYGDGCFLDSVNHEIPNVNHKCKCEWKKQVKEQLHI